MKWALLRLLIVVLGVFGARAAAPSQTHWAFQSISQAPPPKIKNEEWCRTPIDHFIQARLEEAGLQPSPLADPYTLVRRISFDLIGLPPTPAEVKEFVRSFEVDPSSAVRILAERLLDSPQYGERWGRWWLDVARYADTNGQDENKVMANAWRYRDWVIRSFNANKPFDQFITQQLAGDLLPKSTDEKENFERLIGTGFLVLGPKMLAEQDKPKLVMDIIDEQVDTVGRAFLGLTLGCARCHDHKFDPVPARDYYAMAGIFKSTRTMADLAFVSKFNETQIATREELASIKAHEKRMVDLTNRMDAVVREANDSLVAGWKMDFHKYLVAAAAKDANPGSSNFSTNLVGRLRGLLGPDPATNAVGRILHDLSESPDRLGAFFEELKNAQTNTAALQLGPGKIEAGFHATGKNYLELPHAPELDPPQLTVEAWVRVDSFPREGDTRRWVVNKNGNEWVQGHFALLVDSGKAGAYLNIGGTKEDVFSVWSGSQSLKPKEWNHLAFTYDGHDLKLYVNGQPAGETSVQRARAPGTSPLVLGRRQDGYINFNGDLDEVHLFDRALSPAEVKTRFENPDELSRDHVVVSWEFNDLSEEQRRQIDRNEIREALFGKSGLFVPPKDARELYPAETRKALVALESERDALFNSSPAAAAYALAVSDDKPVDVPIHLRGNHLNPAKEPVPRGFVQVVLKKQADTEIPSDHSGRLELARWLTSSENPLTARVIVNRIWQAHFGEGLVRTPENFGIRGAPPSHPELLDFLAHEFIRSGWDIKALHRLIVSSAVYQQSARGLSEAATADPENKLLSHFSRHRLDAEMIRDSVLEIAGTLDRSIGGSLVNWKNNEYVPGDDVSAKSVRRTVYLPIVRDRVYDALTIFDFANPSVCTAQRTATVVSHQALFFMNSPLIKEAAQAVAKSLLASADCDNAARIRAAYERILNRPATDTEVRRTLDFLAQVPHEGVAGDANLQNDFAAFCQALFASNEFVYRF